MGVRTIEVTSCRGSAAHLTRNGIPDHVPNVYSQSLRRLAFSENFAAGRSALWSAAIHIQARLIVAVRSRFSRTIRAAIFAGVWFPQMKTEQKNLTTISINGALLEAAKSEANAHRRSLSSQLEIWIEQSLEAAGKRKSKT
jgi:hypothetical protein